MVGRPCISFGKKKIKQELQTTRKAACRYFPYQYAKRIGTNLHTYIQLSQINLIERHKLKKINGNKHAHQTIIRPITLLSLGRANVWLSNLHLNHSGVSCRQLRLHSERMLRTVLLTLLTGNDISRRGCPSTIFLSHVIDLIKETDPGRVISPVLTTSGK